MALVVGVKPTPRGGQRCVPQTRSHPNRAYPNRAYPNRARKQAAVARSSRSVTLAALLSLLVAAPLFAEGQPQPAKAPKLSFTWKQANAVKQQAQKLLGSGKPAEAAAACETFVCQHPDLPVIPNAFSGVAAIFGKSVDALEDEEAKAAAFLKVWNEFENCPAFRALGAARYVRHLLWKKHDPAAAESEEEYRKCRGTTGRCAIWRAYEPLPGHTNARAGRPI